MILNCQRRQKPPSSREGASPRDSIARAACNVRDERGQPCRPASGRPSSPYAFPRAIKKDSPTAVLFYGFPSTGYCNRRKKKKKKSLTSTGQAQHFFRGAINTGCLATNSHPSSFMAKRVWEGWGSLRGKGDLFVRQPKGPLPPSKTYLPAAYSRASSAHRARRAASCSAFLQLLPLAVNCCPEGRETCTVKCRACSGPSQARVV